MDIFGELDAVHVVINLAEVLLGEVLVSRANAFEAGCYQHRRYAAVQAAVNVVYDLFAQIAILVGKSARATVPPCIGRAGLQPVSAGVCARALLDGTGYARLRTSASGC
jgi:hypothetical protein